MSASPTPTTLPGLTKSSVLRLVLSVGAAAALLGWVLPRVTNTSWAAIVDVLRTVPGLAIAACLFLTVAFVASYAITLRASLPGLSVSRALIVNTAGTSISKVFPGGGAVGLAATFVMCRSWGFSLRAVSTSAVITGVWNVLTRVALPVLAIGLLALTDTRLPGVLRQAALGAAVSGVVILAIFVGVIASDRVADAVGRGLDRVARRFLAKSGRAGRARAAMSDTRGRILERVRLAWHWLTLGMVGFFAAQLGIFLIALHVTGIELEFAAAFAAFAIGRLLTAVGITPGGIGITETGTAAALVALGADPALSAAAVVLMSIFTNVAELPLGVLAWMAWSLDPTATKRSHPHPEDLPPESGQTAPPQAGQTAPPQAGEPSNRRT
jgi:putative heme transporter